MSMTCRNRPGAGVLVCGVRGGQARACSQAGAGLITDVNVARVQPRGPTTRTCATRVLQ